MEEKKKMDGVTKAKLFYCLELGAFSILFLVIAILKFTDVITFSDRYRQWIFPIVTLLGGTWFIIDLIWAIVSPKHREKSCLFDKYLTAPASVTTIGFDIYLLVNGPLNVDYNIFKFYSSSLFIYIAVIYAIQSIYHWYHPLPYLINAIEEAEKEEKEAALKEQQEQESQEEQSPSEN